MFVSVTAMSLTLKRRAATSARSMTGSGIRTACRRPGQAAIPRFGHVAAIEKLAGGVAHRDSWHLGSPSSRNLT
jgi:hypothetical protein